MNDPVSIQRSAFGWRWWCVLNRGSVGGTAYGWALTKRGAVRQGKACWRRFRLDAERNRVEHY